MWNVGSASSLHELLWVTQHPPFLARLAVWADEGNTLIIFVLGCFKELLIVVPALYVITHWNAKKVEAAARVLEGDATLASSPSPSVA